MGSEVVLLWQRTSFFKMGFGDLNIEANIAILHEYLSDKSYIEGFQPSQADVAVFECLSKAPSANYCNALRWYTHIKSYGKSITSFPGIKKPLNQYGPENVAPSAPVKKADSGSDDDSDIDLFGSDDEEEAAEKERIKQDRLAAYKEKKAKKPGPIAKSSVIFDVKPWDDETDMGEVEKLVRTVQLDGLQWGASKLIPLAYGIKKLQIVSTIEDEKVSTEWMIEEIEKFEDMVQSVDIAAFKKI